ncbi:FG-nucleoporin NUP60 NDAI_0J01820 [Naumovozyma dairenensis CBS 421]|uniref:Nucleoporin NUP60 n=1 Tax=Naumovozyma dairenensis (strain ATCC 10597 / BCRC 20456 / CBS 421 / NBRC 0211 / NRRL Y-12639) TaxID=1071378 RepID=G0WGZ6_NAUDC|nr:hypothetical protein NDAI_0J01820 [Naumovozyma dairenensis CBS 421]CCD27074.1 hypothetical protein NDAI_0J01820 [Naumovozyma dairenensis CBS 421]
MSSKLPKSYRSSVKIRAPYRNPIHSDSKKGTNLIAKIKAFFSKPKARSTEKGDGHSNSELDYPSVLESTSKASEPPKIPGTFFTEPSDSLIISSQLSNHKSNSADTEDRNQSSDVSANINYELADFFRRKGATPLNFIEARGVLSLLEKSTGSIKPSGESSFITIPPEDVETAELPSILKASNKSSTPNFELPSFTPTLDTSNGHHGSTATRSHSSSMRRVFDYSRIPSPYRTTIYKYNNQTSEGSDITFGRKSEPTKSRSVTKPRKTPKLSNTASALISLLDTENSETKALSQIANPYSSSIVEHRRPKKESSTKLVIPAKTEIETVPEKENRNSESIFLSQKEDKNISETISIPKRGNKNVKNNQVEKPEAVSSSNSLNMYKPVRSSSLRSSVVVADNESPKKETEGGNVKISSPNPPKAAFTFEFGEPEKSSEPEETKSELAKKFAITSQGNKTQGPEPLLSKDHKADAEIFKETNEIDIVGVPQDNKEAKSGTLASAKVNAPHKDLFPTLSAAVDTKEEEMFDFGTLPPSSTDQQAIDEEKVEAYKSEFVF